MNKVMKTNALEKIYLQENTTTDCYDEFWPEWFEARSKDSDIEYTRTDAFIEKVVKYLKDNVTYTHPRKGTEECIINIPKFIDYMKGE